MLLPELQGYKDTARFIVQGTKVQGYHQKQLTNALIVCFLKKEATFIDP